MKEEEGHALQRLHKSHPTPPCPALRQGMANLSPTSYKYKGTRRRKRGKKRKTWGTYCKRREKQQKVREEEELFEREERLRKKQRGKGNQTWDFFERQRRESESIRGEAKNRDWWS